MKKVLQPLMIAALAMPAFAFANSAQTTTPDKVQQALGAKTAQVQVGADGQVTVASPRTGIRYTFANPNRPIVMQTAAIAAANSAMQTALSQPTRRCLTPVSRKPSRRC